MEGKCARCDDTENNSKAAHSRCVMAHGPLFAVSYSPRIRLTLSSFSTTKPTFGQAIPRGPILKIDRRTPHPATLVGVSAKFLRGVHASDPHFLKEQSPGQCVGFPTLFLLSGQSRAHMMVTGLRSRR